jgi:hypothetical protein
MFWKIAKIILIFILLLTISACESSDVAQTPEVVNATPTQEVDWYVGCLPNGVVPANTNPCFSPDENGLPRDIVIHVEPDVRYQINLNVIERRNSHYVVNLFGDGGFAGSVFFELHGIELLPDQCYQVNFAGSLNVISRDFNELYDNLFATLNIFNNGAITELEQINFFDNDIYNVRNVFSWFIYTRENDSTIVVQVGIKEVEPLFLDGSYFQVDALYIFPIDSNNCVEIN